VRRIEIETTLNEGRNWVLATYGALSAEQLHRAVTPSEHDPQNQWTPLDHFAHLALIEQDFVRMIRRHLAGHRHAIDLLVDERGERRGREEIMALVHARTDAFQREHHEDSLAEVVRLTGRARADTLALLGELSDEQLSERLPGAPWGDGTLGGVLAANADHGRMHWRWVADSGLFAD
jgi:hypothetical protein